MLDVGWGDLIQYLGDDPYAGSIVLCMESIGDAGAFLSAAREVALVEPIIAIEAGRTEVAAKAAASHTGSLAGSDDVLDAAFRRCGVLASTAVRSGDSLWRRRQVRGDRQGPCACASALNSTLALRMMDRTKIDQAPGGARGRKAIDMDALEQPIVRFSQLTIEQQWIEEIDINLLLASADQIIALGARHSVCPRDSRAGSVQTAIRPCPVRYVHPFGTRDETQLLIRTIRRKDEPTISDVRKIHGIISSPSSWGSGASMRPTEIRKNRLRSAGP